MFMHPPFVFTAGVVKLADSSGAWVVTEGRNRGVMQLVGRALRNRVAEGDKALSPLPCIGISTWGRVTRENLKTGDQCNPLEATTARRIDASKLDHNHTHFLMVDDGTERRERTHQRWQARFYRFIEKGGKM